MHLFVANHMTFEKQKGITLRFLLLAVQYELHIEEAQYFNMMITNLPKHTQNVILLVMYLDYLQTIYICYNVTSMSENNIISKSSAT